MPVSPPALIINECVVATLALNYVLHHVRGHHHDHHTLVNAGERDIVSEEGGEEKSAREGACAGATAVGCLWLVPRV